MGLRELIRYIFEGGCGRGGRLRRARVAIISAAIEWLDRYRKWGTFSAGDRGGIPGVKISGSGIVVGMRLSAARGQDFTLAGAECSLRSVWKLLNI